MKKRKRGKQSKKALSKKELQELILSLFRANPTKNYNYKQLYKLVRCDAPEIKTQIVGVLAALHKNGSIIEVRPGKYKCFERALEKDGVVKSVSLRGVLVGVDEKEVFVGLDYSQFAFIGDRVSVLIFPQKKGRKKGEILSVLKRRKTTFVGLLQDEGGYAFLIPDNKKVPFDIFIPKQELKKKYVGKKLLVEVVDWSESLKNPVGKIVSVIGDVNSHNTEIHSILYDYNLSPSFPKKVLDATKKLSINISKKEFEKRKDLRVLDTFTIDPEDAKDFDDALSVKELKDGNWEVGIHIADVSYFIKKGSVLDLEAEKRATSVYLVDRVVPMLPEKISNEICSLKPNEDRLSFSILFKLDKKANVLDFWIGKSVVHSNKRFTYKQAQDIIDSKKGLFSKQLLRLNVLAKILRKNREQKGALTFESPEVKFVLDKDDFPIAVHQKPLFESNHLIEEFMLLANKTIASFIGKVEKNSEKKPFIYRVHDEPDKDKIMALQKLVKQLGYPFNLGSKEKIMNSLSLLQKEVKGNKEAVMVEKLIVRSMAKAVYSEINNGHYGLGFNHYTHFTSPIRRYPDLIVHRLLEQYLDGKNSVSVSGLDKLCKHCSEKERAATFAERDSIKYMQVKYMQNSLGKTFSGIISGVTEWGLYVELVESRCEGLIKIKSLKNDFFIYDEKKFALTGVDTNIQYQLGQNVKVTVKSADLEKRQLNFLIV
jgi:ribonuclease R